MYNFYFYIDESYKTFDSNIKLDQKQLNLKYYYWLVVSQGQLNI